MGGRGCLWVDSAAAEDIKFGCTGCESQCAAITDAFSSVSLQERFCKREQRKHNRCSWGQVSAEAETQCQECYHEELTDSHCDAVNEFGNKDQQKNMCESYGHTGSTVRWYIGGVFHHRSLSSLPKCKWGKKTDKEDPYKCEVGYEGDVTDIKRERKCNALNLKHKGNDWRLLRSCV